MASRLVVMPVEDLQDALCKRMNLLSGTIVFVSLNKRQESTERMLRDHNVPIDTLFFIDCVAADNRKETIHVPPERLDLLEVAIREFLQLLPGERTLVIDSLATLLIYNPENAVASFVQHLAEQASSQEISILALSPKTEGEELLTKVFNFFDTVERT